MRAALINRETVKGLWAGVGCALTLGVLYLCFQVGFHSGYQEGVNENLTDLNRLEEEQQAQRQAKLDWKKEATVWKKEAAFWKGEVAQLKKTLHPKKR